MSSVLLLAACGSARFGGPGPAPVAAVRPGPVYNAPGPALDPVPAVPSSPVSSAPLPPPGAPGEPAGADPGLPSDGPVIADVPEMRGSSAPVGTRQPVPAPAAQVAAVAPTRTSVVGGWTARAGGTTCRIVLSSTSAIDLYRASASGCQNRDLAEVTAWDLRDGEVYLYQRGGAVAARLRAAGRTMDGVLAKSGAPLSLSR